MSDWRFDHQEVLADREGYWWHVVDRWESLDKNQQKYELADATHTEYKTLHKLDVEGMSSEESSFTSLGWTTPTKPATERGYRVNGVLAGRNQIDYWRGTKCNHEYECPECGENGLETIDIIHSIRNRDIVWTVCECRICDHVWREHD
jgi:hypothetical protein